MLYATLVIVEKPEEGESIESVVEKVLASGQDNWWDWWSLGGRWTGALDGYDPEQDERNLEVCDLCQGTGDRKDLEPPKWKAECGGCNGCHGKGKRAKWPTEWARHDGDIVPVETLTQEQYEKFYHIVIDGWGHWAGKEYVPWAEKPEDSFVMKAMPPLDWIKRECPNYLAVVADVHN
jgi:hypothetical protein